MEEPKPTSEGLEPSPSMPSPPCFDNQRQRQRASLPLQTNVTARHSKRLTLNFPINVPQLQNNEIQTEDNSPESAAPSTTMSPLIRSSPGRSTAATPVLSEPPNNEGYGFLTALAAQERKVLELREELNRAESELTMLKNQWQMSEKGRKRTEIVHQAEALKPLKQSTQSPTDRMSVDESDTNTDTPSETPVQSAQPRASRDSYKRHSARLSMSQTFGGNGGYQPPKTRTVFQNSRHTRTLSLLSSATTTNEFKQPFPQPPDANATKNQTNEPTTSEPTNERGSRYPRSATLPSLDRDGNDHSGPISVPLRIRTQDNKASWRRSLPPIPQDVAADALVRTGKQMATDFRDGLWTFLEDIRQATVGEEGINATESRSSPGVQRSQSTSGRPGPGGSMSRERSTASSRTGRSTSSKNHRSITPGRSAATPDVSFWSEFGIDAPDQTPEGRSKQGQHKKADGETSLLDVDDNWDAWEATTQPKKTHTPSSSSSTFPSKRDQSPSTNASSPRTSASLTDLKSIENEHTPTLDTSDGIPWPALTKLHPSKLTRTASNLMDEWERSLSPLEPGTPTFPKEAKDD